MMQLQVLMEKLLQLGSRLIDGTVKEYNIFFDNFNRFLIKINQIIVKH